MCIPFFSVSYFVSWFSKILCFRKLGENPYAPGSNISEASHLSSKTDPQLRFIRCISAFQVFALPMTFDRKITIRYLKITKNKDSCHKELGVLRRGANCCRSYKDLRYLWMNYVSYQLSTNPMYLVPVDYITYINFKNYIWNVINRKCNYKCDYQIY